MIICALDGLTAAAEHAAQLSQRRRASTKPKGADFRPMRPHQGDHRSQRPDWLHEVKYDGYRLRLEREGDRLRLITRVGYWTDRYP
jgi:ATP-dependent DNA ligase